MNAQQEQTVSILRELIETCRDGQEGFRTASECVADDPELKMLLSSFSLQRAKFAGELEAKSIAMGEHHPEQEGPSFSGAVHRGWMNLKAAVTRGDNHAILAECERGEDVAKKAYTDALDHELPEPVREVILSQRQEIIATHNTIRALRDATPSEAAETMATAKKTLRAQKERAAAGATEVWQEMKTKTGELRDSTDRYIRRNPLPSLAWALLAGFSVGMIIYAIELRNERKRLDIMHRPLRTLGLATLGWIGLIRHRAKSRYRAMREQAGELADRFPGQRRGFRKWMKR